jgi:ligand-binding sensor domain-containing protein
VRVRKSIRIQLALLFLTGAVPQSAAQFTFRHYQREQGLTNMVVTSMTQDRRGFIWIGTENGIFRFEGHGFTKFSLDQGLPFTRVYSTLATRDGKIWVGGRNGLAYFDGERFRALRETEALSFSASGRLVENAAGDIYAGTRTGLVRLSKSASGYQVHRISDGPTGGVTVGPDGAVWFGCGTTGLCVSSGNNWRKQALSSASQRTSGTP